MLDIKIYGIRKRDKWIQAYKKVLPISNNDIIYDDRPNGGNCYYTCKKAWLEPIPEGVTHRLCLPDDVQLCQNFLDIIDKIIKTHPDKVICLFPYDHNTKIKYALRQNTPYYKVNIMCCCGVIMPVRYIKDCFEWIDNYYETQEEIIDDIGMQKYFNANNVPYITTLPATVQHIGDVSIVTPDAPIRKTDCFIDDLKGITVNWECKKIGWLAGLYYNEDKNLFGHKHNNTKRYVIPDKYKL